MLDEPPTKSVWLALLSLSPNIKQYVRSITAPCLFDKSIIMSFCLGLRQSMSTRDVHCHSLVLLEDAADRLRAVFTTDT